MADEPVQPDDDGLNSAEFFAKAFESIESNEDISPLEEAWLQLHEMYTSLRGAGFSQNEAVEIVSAYLFRMLNDSGGS